MKKRKKIIIILLSALAIILLVSFFVFKKDKVKYTTAVLQRQDLKQTVSEVGTLRASQEIGLNFLQAGNLNELHVAVGDEVSEGQILAELDYSSLSIRHEEVMAVLKIAQTNQEKLIKGASQEDIVVLEAQLRQAESSHQAAMADLENIKNIVKENISQSAKILEDLKAPNNVAPMLLKQSVESARLNLSNIKKSGQQNINNAQVALLSSFDYNFSVAKSALDAVNRILKDENIKNVFSVRNYYNKIETENLYNSAIRVLPDIESSIKNTKLDPNKENFKKTAEDLSLFLEKTFALLNACFSALESTITSSSFPQSALDTFKANVNSGKSQINSVIAAAQNSYFSYSNAVLNNETSVLSAQDNLLKAEASLSDAISNAENTFSLAKVNGEQQISSAEARLDAAAKNFEVIRLQLVKLKTPAKSEDLKLAQSQVDQAQANLDLITKQIEDNILKAPINGKVVKINYEVGEQVNGSQAVIALLAENNFEIEALISESDISKVKVSDPVSISFDAFGEEEKVEGQVYFIEPASTSISGVIYYKIKINFTEDSLIDKNLILRSGLTANLDITTDFKTNVLAVPARAVLSRNNNEFYVRVLKGKKIEEYNVKTGINADQAMLEIESDELKEGDIIIISIKNK